MSEQQGEDLSILDAEIFLNRRMDKISYSRFYLGETVCLLAKHLDYELTASGSIIEIDQNNLLPGPQS